MTTTLRIDDGLKRDCEIVLNDLGLSMSGAVTIFLKQVVKQRAIPFIISCDRRAPYCQSAQSSTGNLNARGRIAMRYAAEMRDSSEREWTMAEIDAEIAAARKECLEKADV